MTAREKKQTSQVPDAVPLASQREWMGLAVLALPALLISMDLSVLYLAVPRLSAALQPSSVQLLWITDVYGFLLAGFLLPMGALGDRIGRRKLLMIGGAVFGGASVVAAFSTSAATLIAARAVMGIAAATLAPSSLALLSNMFKDPRQRTRAISLWATSLSAGGAVGPIVGGVLLNFFWWGSVFLVAVPVMLLLVMTAPLFLPEYRNPQAARLDLTSVALSLGTLLLVIYGLKQIAQNGLGWMSTLAIVAGLMAGVIFVRRQRVLRRAVARSAAVPRARLQCLSRHQHARFFRGARRLFLHRSIPAIGAGALAAVGRTLERAFLWRIHPRVPAGPAPGALCSPSFCDGCRPGSGVNWLRHPYPGRDHLRTGRLRDRVGRAFTGDGTSLHAGHQHGTRLHCARASRCSLRDVGDEH